MVNNDVSYKCLEEYSVVLTFVRTSGFMKDYTNAPLCPSEHAQTMIFSSVFLQPQYIQWFGFFTTPWWRILGSATAKMVKKE